MTNLLRPIFLNPHDGRERRGYRTHLQDSTGKPLCGIKQRSFGLGEGVAVARWEHLTGKPTCPVCQRIAKRGGKAA